MANADVCVIGGGPAGLATAIALRLSGRSVVLLEANSPPIDKACGEGLMPDTLEDLGRLGVRLPLSQGFPFRGIRFFARNRQAEAKFKHDLGLGLRRTILHRVLHERAEELGVAMVWGTRGVSPIALGMVESRLTVGADGQNSTVRKAAGLEAASLLEQRFGFRRHYAIAPWSSYVEVYWAPKCQVYVTPISAREVGVAVLTSDPRQRLQHALPLFPVLQKRLASAQHVSAERGALTSMRRLRQVCTENVALVGDASGSVDAITGEGIGLAVRQALALADTVQNGRNLEQYAREHRRIGRRPALLARLLLHLSKFDALHGPVVAGLASIPSVFDRLLALHVSGSYTSGAGTGSGVDICCRPNPERLNSQS